MVAGGVEEDRGGLSVSSTAVAAGDDLVELVTNKLLLFVDLLGCLV